MNFRQLKALRAVVISGSITDAGKLLQVSQRAVIRLVAELERSVGLRLFERRAGRITPMPEAMTSCDEVERLFVGIDQLHGSAREIRNLRTARLQEARAG